MRDVFNPMPELGLFNIEDLEFDLNDGDDLPPILLALQQLYRNPELKQRLFQLLSEEALPGVNLNTGRPALGLWQIVVLGVVKQGLRLDFDRLYNQVNHHDQLQQMPGHPAWMKRRYTKQELINNVNVLSAELLVKVSDLIVAACHGLAGHNPGEWLRGRCDSFVVETDVHFPSDVGLLWDAVQRLLRLMRKASERHQVRGWRQHKHLRKQLKKRCNRVRKSAQAKPAAVSEYLDYCSQLTERAGETLCQLQALGVEGKLCEDIVTFKGYADQLSDQVQRRLLHGETIPQSEKIFSVFEPHTRWVSKGKAGRPVELGVPVCILEDQHRMILHHALMWQGEDVDDAVPMVKAAQRRYADLRQCSFDRGFHSPENRRQLDELLDVNVLPAKGKLSAAAKQRESEPVFKAARQQHPAVESKINDLEQRGLDRVRTHGAKGFERSVAWSVLASNLHRYGRLVRDQLRDKERPRLKLAA